MTEAPLMNDEAARSPTGEILDQQTQTTMEPKSEPSTTTTSTDPKSSEPTPDPTKTEPKAADPAKPVVPETYADFKAPDGYQIDKALIAEALPIFKDLGLTQDQAQKLVDIQIQRDLAQATARDSTYTTLRNDWRAKTTSDPDLTAATSGDKTGLDAVKLDIGRAYAALPPALATEMRAAMDLTGAGDHPAIIKGFWKLAQFVTEGRHVTGGNPSPRGQDAPGKGKPDAAHALYPNLPG